MEPAVKLYSMRLAAALEAQVALDKKKKSGQRYARELARSVARDQELSKARAKLHARIDANLG